VGRNRQPHQRWDSKTVVGYVRVSTDEQTLEPGAQRAALQNWCASRSVVLADVFTDQGVSGGAALDKRPGLLAALAALKQYNASILLVARRDRLARDVLVAALVERLVERDGATVQSADGTADGAGPEAVLMRRILDAFAEYERLVIRARTRAALALKRSRGERTGGIPYGYRLAADGVHLEPCRTEQRVLRMVRRYHGRGFTLRRIAARLQARGMLPRSGTRWHPQTIASIVAAAPPVSPCKA
jgi:DNA invertase Pin-like site-specific DNA recombinase